MLAYGELAIGPSLFVRQQGWGDWRLAFLPKRTRARRCQLKLLWSTGEYCIGYANRF
jgi:hypothetical protein